MDSSTNPLARAAELLREASGLIQSLSTGQQTHTITESNRRTGAGLSNEIASSGSTTPTFTGTGISSITPALPSGGRLRYFQPSSIGNSQSALDRVSLQSTSAGVTSPTSSAVRLPGASPAPDVSIIAEMRRNFQPYSRTPTRRQSSTIRSGLGTSRNRNFDVNFTRSFLCLGGPYETLTPGANRRSALAANGLGQTMITLNRGLTRENLEGAFRAEFPKLEGCHFELLRAIGSGQGKPLDRLSRSHAIPPVEMLISVRTGIVYIRPVTSIFHADVDEQVPEVSFPNTHAIASHEVMEIDTIETETSTSRASTPDRSTFNYEHEAIRQTLEPGTSNPRPDLSSCVSSAVVPEVIRQRNVNCTEGLTASSLIHDITSMDGYREYLFGSAPGFQYMLITRDLLLEEMLGFYLKDHSFNYKQRTMVKFIGEPGRDVSALSKEYFTIGINTLKNANFFGNHSLLEGEVDHLLPTRDPLLKSSGYYKFLGKFMGHAAVHLGIAFIGFSFAAVRYIFGNDEMNDLTLTTSDIPDYDARQIMTKLTSWADGTEPDDESKERIVYALQECNIFDAPTRRNLRLLEQQFIEWQVLTSRATFLDEIRIGFQSTGFYEFVKEREYLWGTLFPTEASLTFCADDIIAAIRFDYEDAIPVCIKEAVAEFVSDLDSRRIRDLLQCWTGSPSIPPDGLEIKIVEDGRFIVHACFNQIEIPRDLEKSELLQLLNTAINYGVFGFGEV